MKKKTLYALVEKINYRGKKSPGVFEAGFVKYSVHKENTVYLQIIQDFVFEFTDDEAMAVINVLSYTLWQRNVPMSTDKKKKLKWETKNTEAL